MHHGMAAAFAEGRSLWIAKALEHTQRIRGRHRPHRLGFRREAVDAQDGAVRGRHLAARARRGLLYCLWHNLRGHFVRAPYVHGKPVLFGLVDVYGWRRTIGHHNRAAPVVMSRHHAADWLVDALPANWGLSVPVKV